MRERIIERLRGTRAPVDVASAARAGFPAEIARDLFPGSLVPAAVLLPLWPRGDGFSVLLTRRTETLRDHPGQISFPGGRLDEQDAGPLMAALRETTEELGVPPDLVEVVGYLPSVAVVTGFAVTPVVGFLPPDVELQPDPLEVAEVFEVPLDFLFEPGNARRVVRRVGAHQWPSYEFEFEGRRIWGATASILRSFVHVVSEINHSND